MAGVAKRKVAKSSAAMPPPKAAADAPAATAPPCRGAVGESGCGSAARSPRLVATGDETT
jgi:hypothetical protein